MGGSRTARDNEVEFPRTDDLIFAGKIAEILGIERTQAWRLLRAGIIQQAVQNVETRMWSAPRAQVEALRIERERSKDGRVKRPPKRTR